MGFLATDITPLSSTGPTVLIPTSKVYAVKVFSVSRTNTSATLKAILPADASITNVWFYRGTASDAGTTASVTITVANNTGTISSGSYDVKTNGAVSGVVQMTNLPNIQPTPLLGDLQITAQYAETGTASTTGGPWNILVEYVR